MNLLELPASGLALARCLEIASGLCRLRLLTLRAVTVSHLKVTESLRFSATSRRYRDGLDLSTVKVCFIAVI